MQRHVVLNRFKPVLFGQLLRQKEILEYTAWLMAAVHCVKNKITSQEEANAISLNIRKDVNKFGLSPLYISQRQFNIFPDSIAIRPGETPKLPHVMRDLKKQPEGIGLKERTHLYRQRVSEIFQTAYNDIALAPDELIHATCSGYISPSPAQALIVDKKWMNTKVTHCYHMGCYAAVPAVRMALGSMASSQLLGKPHQRVDIMHTEFLSLHFDPARHDAEHIINMTLFADGFIRYSACFEDDCSVKHSGGLKILACFDELIPNSLNEMTWIPGPHCFEMTLSKYVPGLICSIISEYVQRLCLQAGFVFSEEKDNIILALHPGGPKIIDRVQEDLGLKDCQVQFSRDVLFHYGNMSSATLPHIWKAILEDETVKSKTKIISIAFGPGLIAAGLVFEKV